MVAEIRASDDDRQRVVELLQRHTEVGRLTLDEFSDRVGDVWAARTLGDLAAVTEDLPAEPAPPDAPAGAGPPAAKPVSRDLLLLFAVAALTLVLLVVYMAATR